jgi:hypothetical protein
LLGLYFGPEDILFFLPAVTSFMLVSCLAYSSALKIFSSFYLLLPASCWFLAWHYSSILNMEAICPSETSVYFQRTTRRFTSEYRTLHNHRCVNLTSYIL